jgi:hypothetical protein
MFSGKPRVLGSWLLPFMLLWGGCNKPAQVKNAPPASPVQQMRSAEPRIAACGLVTMEEVGAIQRATIIDAKSSGGPSGDMLMSQCYYTSKEPNQSVSLAIVQANSQNPSGSDIKKYWEDSIQRFTEQAEEEKGKEARGEEEKKIPPKKIEGVGEEAYWSASRVGGALYVLTKDVIIRVSVGGPDNEQTKIDKSKALAQKAIDRI